MVQGLQNRHRASIILSSLDMASYASGHELFMDMHGMCKFFKDMSMVFKTANLALAYTLQSL